MALARSMLLLGLLAMMVGTVIGDTEASCLASANSYRRKHKNTEDFEWDAALATAAQAYAEKLLDIKTNGGTIVHDENANAGENLAYRLADDADDVGSVCGSADERWYDEINNYNWDTGLSKGGAIGHFTQMVWAGSTKVGYGVAVGRNPVQFNPNSVYTIRIVVGRYLPAGNTYGRYLDNVHGLISGAESQPTSQPTTQPSGGNGGNEGSVVYASVTSSYCTTQVTKIVCLSIANNRGIEVRQIINKKRHFPSGCYHKQSNNKIYFNEKQPIEPCTTNRICICIKE